VDCVSKQPFVQKNACEFFYHDATGQIAFRDCAECGPGTNFFHEQKTRNRLLAVGCLLVFLALGAFFYVEWEYVFPTKKTEIPD